MDSRLKDRLIKLEAAIQDVTAKERVWRPLGASEKAFLARLTLQMEGKSMLERETKAMASPEWMTFIEGLSTAEVDYNHARRMLELQHKAYDAEHVTYKIESDGIRRQ